MKRKESHLTRHHALHHREDSGTIIASRSVRQSGSQPHLTSPHLHPITLKENTARHPITPRADGSQETDRDDTQLDLANYCSQTRRSRLQLQHSSDRLRRSNTVRIYGVTSCIYHIF